MKLTSDPKTGEARAGLLGREQAQDTTQTETGLSGFGPVARKKRKIIRDKHEQKTERRGKRKGSQIGIGRKIEGGSDSDMKQILKAIERMENSEKEEKKKKEHEEWQARIRRQIQQRGKTIHVVAGDGHCGYHAIADQVNLKRISRRDAGGRHIPGRWGANCVRQLIIDNIDEIPWGQQGEGDFFPLAERERIKRINERGIAERNRGRGVLSPLYMDETQLKIIARALGRGIKLYLIMEYQTRN